MQPRLRRRLAGAMRPRNKGRRSRAPARGADELALPAAAEDRERGPSSGPGLIVRNGLVVGGQAEPPRFLQFIEQRAPIGAKTRRASSPNIGFAGSGVGGIDD